MKKRMLLVACLLCGTWAPGAFAQVSNVNPIPQEVEKKGTPVAAPKSWTVKYDKSLAGSFALTALNQAAQQQEAKADFTLKLGVKGQRTVKSVAKRIPDHAEGYYLELTSEGATVAGADERGLFYGVQTLLAILRDGKLEPCTVTDWPDVAFRGVVEGFYGTPWSHEARLRQFRFYGRNKMNVYIYGPKDDPYHRAHWRTPYPAAEAQRIRQLADSAKANGVHFYWAIHPGIDIKWTDADRDSLVAKFEQMYDLGVRSFAVFFDDIWGEGTKADKQAQLLNYVDENFIQKKPDVSPLIMCPTEYNRSWASDKPDGYLRTMGRLLNKDIHIMWTGNSVVHLIDKPTMEWVNPFIDRKAYIWWNYPVTDYVRDHLMIGPVYGNGQDIASDLSGFVSNPMQHAEASKIALYAIADYTWNMEDFDAQRDWEKSLKDLLPGAVDALRVFAHYNEDPGPNGHGFRREESPRIVEIAQQLQQTNDGTAAVQALMEQCAELKAAADILLVNRENPDLVRELRPWLLQARNVADYGVAVCQMKLSAGQSAQPGSLRTFDAYYLQARSLQEQMYQLENSDVRHPLQPGIKVGAKELLPTLNALFARTVTSYNTAHQTAYDPVAEYQPYKLTSDVPQLAQQPVSTSGNTVKVAPSNEVIAWPAGASLLLEAEQPVTLQGMSFDLGVAGVASKFRLEVMVDGAWKTVSLMHYKPEETVIHTGNELSGMKAEKIRLTNSGGEDLQVYLRSFQFTKQ